jgi:hypothetical protein
VFRHLVENVSRGVLACGPLPLSRPVLQEAPQALALIPEQIMVLPKQSIPLTHRGHGRPPGRPFVAVR